MDKVEFEGPFGIINSGRPNVRIEQRKGYMVDRDLLDLLLMYQIKG